MTVTTAPVRAGPQRPDRPVWGSSRLPLLVLPVGIAVGLLAELSLARAGLTAEGLLVDALSGYSFVLAGLVAWHRRPENRVGPIMVGIGLSWFAGDFLFAPVPVIGPASLLGQFTARVLFAWLLLAFPSGRLGSDLHRWGVGLVAAQAGALAVVQLVTFEIDTFCACPSNPFAVAAGTPLASQVQTLSALVGIGMTAVLVPLVIRRAIVASRPARRALIPVLIGGAFSYLSTTPELIGYLLDTSTPAISWLPLVWVALPAGFLFTLLSARMARGAVADLVIRLGNTPEPEHFREALSTALRDPTLEVVRWSTDVAGYLAPDGRPVELPQPGSGRAVTILEGDRGKVGAIVHDAALLDDPGLVASVGAAMRLAVENEQLQAEVEAQLEEVRASRARIVAAGDAERRRVERNLHDGAQQRLVALSLVLRRARAQLPPDSAPESVATLDEAAEQLRTALAELRELARGIHPAVLTEAGLEAALRALARGAPIPVRIDIDIDRPIPAPVEAAAYFVAAEALANVAKYAEASEASIRAQANAEQLTMVIADDGQGGADPAAGSGLRGLTDRVAALGGQLEVVSPLGGGTTITSRLPIGGASGPA